MNTSVHVALIWLQWINHPAVSDKKMLYDKSKYLSASFSQFSNSTDKR